MQPRTRLLLLKAAPTTKPAEKRPARKLQPKWKNCSQTLQVQQEELRLLKEELAKHGKQIEEARASEATVKATEAATTSAEVKSTTTALNSPVSGLAPSNAAAAIVNTSASNPRAQYANDHKRNPFLPLRDSFDVRSRNSGFDRR
jgi:hypothetical protein